MLPALPTGMERVERAVEILMDLEGRGLLAFDAELVHRVDEHDRVRLGQLAHELQRLVEVAREGDHTGAVDQRLGHLAWAIFRRGRSPRR